jgi:hypothetical protein
MVHWFILQELRSLGLLKEKRSVGVTETPRKGGKCPLSPRQRAAAEQIASSRRQPPPPRRVLDLPKPPKSNRPDWLAGAWALPKRDEAGLALFAEE